SESPRNSLQGLGRITIADEPNIQVETRGHFERSANRSFDPALTVAESTPAKAGEEDDIGCTAPSIQDGGPHRCLVRSLQHERSKRRPEGSGHLAVCHGQGRAEGLRYDRTLFSVRVRDL